MDTLSLQLFLRIADLGVVSAAARDLSLSPASASARLSKLEEHIGFRLFHRSTRAVTLTTDGSAFLPYARQTIESLEQGLSAVKGFDAEASGLLRITMPGSFGRMHLVPALATFQARHPNVQLDLRLSDEVLDVVEGAYDLVIRNAPLGESNMIARKLAADQRILVASPDYLAQHGTPKTVADLATHRWVVFSGGHRLKFAHGEMFNTPWTIIVNDGEAMRTMIERGMGIGMKSLWNAAALLHAGNLVEVLPNVPLVTESSIWALYPKTRLVTPKVRAMIDFLLELFQPVPPWEIP